MWVEFQRFYAGLRYESKGPVRHMSLSDLDPAAPACYPPHMRKTLIGILAALAVCLWLQAQEREKVDLSIAHRIRDEAFGRNSKVMDTAFWLTDRYGPRLTGSPQVKEAADWAVKKMTEW